MNENVSQPLMPEVIASETQSENAALRRALGQKASPPLSNIEFQAACGKYLVDPGLALESKEVLAAIKAGSLTALRSALVNEF